MDDKFFVNSGEKSVTTNKKKHGINANILLVFLLFNSAFWFCVSHVCWSSKAFLLMPTLSNQHAWFVCFALRKCFNFYLVNRTWELTAPPFLLLRKDGDQIQIEFSADSLEVVRRGWFWRWDDIIDCQPCAWLLGKGGTLRGRQVWQICGTAMEFLPHLPPPRVILTAVSIMKK